MLIDAVFTWVDDADPAWREQKRLRRQAFFADRPPPDGRGGANDADHPARFRDNDELRYALRSLARFAPWIRTAHLVTADQKPVWLNENTVHLVSHRDIFPDPALLPVFNSHPIEFCLHRIPGLAEQFLCFNDDMLLGRPVSPKDFFLPDGTPLLWALKRGRRSMRKRLSPSRTSASHAIAVANAHRLIRDRYGLAFPFLMGHYPKAMTRRSAATLWDAFPDAVAETLASAFRSPDDVVPTMLYPLYALAAGLGQARVVNGIRQSMDMLRGRGPAYMGASLGDRNLPAKMRAIRLLRPRTFCCNDAPRASEADRARLRDFLESLFPEPCKYELPQN